MVTNNQEFILHFNELGVVSTYNDGGNHPIYWGIKDIPDAGKSATLFAIALGDRYADELDADSFA